jgi:glycosyltransferase involved in cell wall biosynthesis
MSARASSRPIVTAVVPAYNAERTLASALASIATQTVREVEVIVVDDGSTDQTVRVARGSGIPDLRVISQPNAGHAAARNTGIIAARGRYLAFLDADDLWLPRKLERQLETIRVHPHIRALQTGAARVDDNLRVLWTEECRPAEDQLGDVLCFRNMPALMSTLLVERGLLEEVGPFDPSLIILQDWDLAIRLARRRQLHSIRDVLAAYRFHQSQSSNVEIHIEPGLRILDRLFTDPGLPQEILGRRREAYAWFYAMLSGGAVKVGRYPYAIAWGLRALATDPRVAPYLSGFPARRLKRIRQSQSASHAVSFPPQVVDASVPAPQMETTTG